MYDDVKQAIIGLSGALKVGAEHVYGVLVKQQIVESIIFLILIIIGFILLLFGIKYYKDPNEKWLSGEGINEAPTFLGVIRALQIVLGIILFMIGVINIDVIITGFINPEYGALEEIMNMIK